MSTKDQGFSLTFDDSHKMAFYIISPEATGQIVTKVYVEPSGAEGTKTCSNGPGQMTDMACDHSSR